MADDTRELEENREEFDWITCPVPLCNWRIFTHSPSLAESLINRHKLYGHVQDIESELF